ncbi:MAG: class I SAM-dependent methyltransferase [Thermoleophilaceae bacterium]|nr:class I SAM-dependent methyltransferase [Thermoleophilaceae bacterium]
MNEAVVWHDVECAAYAADLALWEELAGPGPLLDIGAGTGRVALHLARRGAAVTAIDSDPALVDALAHRARAEGLRIHSHCVDARSFDLGRQFAVVILPMQVVQLLGGSDGRNLMLASVRRHLAPGGLVALALADPFDEAEDPSEHPPPLPDVREEDGWVFQSRPVIVRPVEHGAAIERLREVVSPDGTLSESANVIVLDRVEPGTLEREALAHRFRVAPRRVIPPTQVYVGSDVVVLEAV